MFEVSKLQAWEVHSLKIIITQSEDKKGESYHVLVTAGAGTGKTLTFLQLAAMKWARKDIWPEFSIVVV